MDQLKAYWNKLEPKQRLVLTCALAVACFMTLGPLGLIVIAVVASRMVKTNGKDGVSSVFRLLSGTSSEADAKRRQLLDQAMREVSAQRRSAEAVVKKAEPARRAPTKRDMQPPTPRQQTRPLSPEAPPVLEPAMPHPERRPVDPFSSYQASSLDAFANGPTGFDDVLAELRGESRRDGR